jgi:ankyrin repeat protein
MQHNLGAARTLLEAKCLVDEADLRGRTPLRTAVQHGHRAAARLLLDYGADPNNSALQAVNFRYISHKTMCIYRAITSD